MSKSYQGYVSFGYYVESDIPLDTSTSEGYRALCTLIANSIVERGVHEVIADADLGDIEQEEA